MYDVFHTSTNTIKREKNMSRFVKDYILFPEIRWMGDNWKAMLVSAGSLCSTSDP